MASEASAAPSADNKRRFDWLHVTLLVLVAILVTAGITYWLVTTYIFPSEFTPVVLSSKEQRVLNEKLGRFDVLRDEGWRRTRGAQRRSGAADGEGSVESLTPERYSEIGASRDIMLTERELNALLANNTDLAHRLAIDLADDLVSAKLIIPVDEDFPILGGKTLRVRAGVELTFAEQRPIVVLKGVSIMGVPLPNAWLGGLKNIDLIREYGEQEGFWRAFAEGVAALQVEEGRLRITLRE